MSLVILTTHDYSEAAVHQAQAHYSDLCRSFVYHRFSNLSPSRSLFVKAWHYLIGYPRHGFWSREADEVLKQAMNRTGAQVLWCNTTFDAKYLRTAKRMGCATVLSTQNVESEVVRQQGKQTSQRSWLTSVQCFDMRRLERFGSRWADVVTAMTNLDLAYYSRLRKARGTFLLPFAYSAGAAAGGDSQREHGNTICFVGSMNWAPNVVAAEYLVQRVMPLVWRTVPDATCFLVGRNPTESVCALRSEKVIVTGSVQSVGEYYDRAGVVVVPMQDVSGVKIKLIEALAAGKAVVTSSAGKAGLSVQPGKHLLVADNPADFAAAIVQLLDDNGERERLGCEAQRFVAENVSPNQTKQQVNAVFEYLTGLGCRGV